MQNELDTYVIQASRETPLQEHVAVIDGLMKQGAKMNYRYLLRNGANYANNDGTYGELFQHYFGRLTVKERMDSDVLSHVYASEYHEDIEKFVKFYLIDVSYKSPEGYPWIFDVMYNREETVRKILQRYKDKIDFSKAIECVIERNLFATKPYLLRFLVYEMRAPVDRQDEYKLAHRIMKSRLSLNDFLPQFIPLSTGSS